MTDEQRQAEIAALKRIAEGHRQIIDAMLTNNHAFMTLIEASVVLNGYKEKEKERKPNLRVLKAQ